MKDVALVLGYAAAYGAMEAAYLKSTSSTYARSFEAVQGGRPFRVRAKFAVLAYVVLLPVVYWFLVRSIHQARTVDEMPSLASVCLNATMLALAIYGVYNLTNLATLSSYSTSVAAQDTLWGVTVLNAVGVFSWALWRWLLKGGVHQWF